MIRVPVGACAARMWDADRPPIRVHGDAAVESLAAMGVAVGNWREPAPMTGDGR